MFMIRKFSTSAALAVALLFLVSCGEHGFLDEILGEASSSSESLSGETQSSSSGGEALPSSSSNEYYCQENKCSEDDDDDDELSSSSSGSIVLLSSSSIDDEKKSGDGDYTLGVVGPLLKTQWAQGSPYKDMTPVNESGTHATAGCVAVAMAQIMKHHNHPVQGNGRSEPYTTTKNGIQMPSVNFNVSYDWNNMLNAYRSDGRDSDEQQRNAVATLIYHAGASIQMNYGFGSSDGSVDKAIRALIDHFGYDKGIERHLWQNHDDVAWKTLIRRQLDAGQPIFYSGNGHTQIIDGYDNQDRFHVNCGWGGSDDGWFPIDEVLCVNRGNNTTSGIFTNIKPNAGGPPAPYEMVLTNFTVSKTAVSQNELFAASSALRNLAILDTFPGGLVGTALADNNGGIVAVIGSRSFSARSPGSTSSVGETFSFVPDAVAPGQYQLRVVIKPTNGEWKLVEQSAFRNGIPNSIPITVTPAEKGSPGGGYGMALTAFSTSKTTMSQSELISGIITSRTAIAQNELFTVSTAYRNAALDTFPGGQAGAALVDNSGSIIAVIGSRSLSARNPNTTVSTGDAYSYIPSSIAPGQYKLRAVIKQAGSDEWRVATLAIGGVPSSIPITVTPAEKGSPGGGYGLVLEKFESSKSSVAKIEDFTVTAVMRNRGLDAFPAGSLGVALVDGNGNIAEVIKTITYSALSSGSSRTSTISNCAVPNSVASGRYKLRMVVKPADGEWRIATLALPDVPNSIDFEVR
jgi:hypothetical protein